MDFERAKYLLSIHAFTHPDVLKPDARAGFLRSLRPYRGTLIEENFHEVMAAIVAVAPHIYDRAYVDRRIVADLWGICTRARDWGLHPDGMLRRNGLIGDEDVAHLEEWVDAIDYAVETPS